MKAITRIEAHADLLLAQAVDTLANTYTGQTKVAHENGYPDRAKILKVVGARAMKLHSRGWPWRYIRVTDATVPQM